MVVAMIVAILAVCNQEEKVVLSKATSSGKGEEVLQGGFDYGYLYGAKDACAVQDGPNQSCLPASLHIQT